MGKGRCDGLEGENDPSPEASGPAERGGRRQSGSRARLLSETRSPGAGGANSFARDAAQPRGATGPGPRRRDAAKTHGIDG